MASDAERVYAAMRHGEVCQNNFFLEGTKRRNPTPRRAFIKAKRFAQITVWFFQVLVFDGCTFLLETVLEGRKEPVWQVCNQISLLFQLVLKLDRTILYGRSATRYSSIDNQF